MDDYPSFDGPPQTFTHHDQHILPEKKTLLEYFNGQHLSHLRTPAFVVDRSVVQSNCANMLSSTKQLKAKFRAHVKTHKTVEGVRFQLSSGGHNTDSVVVSTLMEAWRIINSELLTEGLVQDILYGLPVPLNKIADLWDLSQAMVYSGGVLKLLVDHPNQLDALADFWHTQPDGPVIRSPPWTVFVKVDVNYKRAGVLPESEQFHELINQIHGLQREITLCGFYCHAGNSYSSKSREDASSFLTDEILCVNKAARITREIMSKQDENLSHSPRFTLSVGSTPTAHASSISPKRVEELQKLLDGDLEIHAGNYIFHDLQQQATSLVGPDEIAFRVLATVVSHYKGRGIDGTDELMVDVGGIGMSKDTGQIEGYGNVVAIIPPLDSSSPTSNSKPKWLWSQTGWRLGRISQEHGILVRDPSSGLTSPPLPPIGSIVSIVGQHACLTAANHPWYYIVDSSLPAHKDDGGRVGERVVDIWVPWKGW